MIMRFEVCADSVAGVLAAQRAGADRVELCSGLFEGGITPSAGLLVATAAVAEIPVMVLIRPRGGDFCYDEHERRAMITDIAMARETGAAGVVIGALTADGDVDVELCAELMRAADGMEITFHRAFDLARDPFAALDAVISLGAQRLLTSGQDRSALDGAELIKQLVQRAGDRLVVMPGGGVTERNVARLLAQTGATEVHFSAGSAVTSEMEHRNTSVFLGAALRPPEYARTVTDENLVRRIIDAAG